MDRGVIAVIGLSAFLLVWYFAASSFNRRRGTAAYRWLRRGLGELGEITQAKWFGSSGTGANIVVANPAKPLRKIEAYYYLETREIFPYWLVTHLWGKRDELTIEATLRFAPKVEYKIGNTQSKVIAEAASNDEKDLFERVQAPEGFTILRRGNQDDDSLEMLNEFLTAAGESVWSVHLKRSRPHIVIHSKINPLLEKIPESIFTALHLWLQSIRN